MQFRKKLAGKSLFENFLKVSVSATVSAKVSVSVSVSAETQNWSFGRSLVCNHLKLQYHAS